MNTIELIEYIHNLINPEKLTDEFEAKKLKSQLLCIRRVYQKNEAISDCIQIVLDSFFSEGFEQTNIITPKPSTQSIDLRRHYKGWEIKLINQYFGFAKDNYYLSETDLESGYLQNQGIKDIDKWYKELKFYLFTNPNLYSSDKLQAITSEIDEFIYERNSKVSQTN